MCGIVGYIGTQPAIARLLHGLRELEYRGYDSAGVAVLGSEGLRCFKAVGKQAGQGAGARHPGAVQCGQQLHRARGRGQLGGPQRSPNMPPTGLPD
ncbi:Glutamine--fructose-6-phosphate aminotransferase [isomerizing] [Thiorhodovibrio winogradskyi]|uniref:Glutamine--fructose-6-phosphate aminotransferase [isomerizing] n=1 Tax=Thiorhodovibrio winogradskyi TaxID=77007 RepID=A0ABZ0SEG5_9GAMM|nr:hypothetical protein [Thiorhodovibrio winogradskyi]